MPVKLTEKEKADRRIANLAKKLLQEIELQGYGILLV